MAEHYLKYIGNGRAIPGVPASDHVVSTKAEADELVKSGFYEEVKEPPKASEKEEA